MKQRIRVSRLLALGFALMAGRAGAQAAQHEEASIVMPLLYWRARESKKSLVDGFRREHFVGRPLLDDRAVPQAQDVMRQPPHRDQVMRNQHHRHIRFAIDFDDEVIEALQVLEVDAGTRLVDGRLVADGGRVLNVVGLGKDLATARDKAYAAIDHIRWPGGFCRHGICSQ